MDFTTYVHGYSPPELQRLSDQAVTLSQLLHHDSVFNPPGLVLEAGCGTGAQTATIAAQNPKSSFISIDISEESLLIARERIREKQIGNVSFHVADLLNMPFPDETFDHVFVCFVLEHLPDSSAALYSLKRVLKKGGTITAIEGDHESAFFHPDSESARATIRCLIDVQASLGGNSLIGRELYPMFCSAGLHSVSVSPRFVYADGGHPEMQDGFTRKTFAAMVSGIRAHVLGLKMMSQAEWDKGIADLYRSSEPDGTFCYTFFKATGIKQ